MTTVRLKYTPVTTDLPPPVQLVMLAPSRAERLYGLVRDDMQARVLSGLGLSTAVLSGLETLPDALRYVTVDLGSPRPLDRWGESDNEYRWRTGK